METSAGVGIWGEGSIPQTSLQNLEFTGVRRELGVRAFSGGDAGNLAVGSGVGLWAPGASRRQLRLLSRCIRPGRRRQEAGGGWHSTGRYRARSRERDRAGGPACRGLYLLVRKKEPKSSSPASSCELETKWNLKAPHYREKAALEPGDRC